jgi:hypothetical protein
MDKNYLEKLLSEQKIKTYLDCVWKDVLEKSTSFFHQRHNRLHAVIKVFANDTQLRQLMPYFDMDTMYFKPYIGSNYDFWLKENKSVDYFLNEKNKGIAICYKNPLIIRQKIKYKGKVVENILGKGNSIAGKALLEEAYENGELDLIEIISEKEGEEIKCKFAYDGKVFDVEYLEEIVIAADKKGELDLVEMYIENGEYCLLDFDSTPFFCGTAAAVAEKFKEKFMKNTVDVVYQKETEKRF